MKSDNLEIASEACCSTTNETIENQESCCAQPVDGTDCCDKSADKATNAEKTGCC